MHQGLVHGSSGSSNEITQGGIVDYYIDTSGDGNYDTVVSYNIDSQMIYQRSGGRSEGFMSVPFQGTTQADVNEKIRGAAQSITKKGRYGSGASGATMGGRTSSAHGGEGGGGDDDGEYGLESLNKSDFFEADGTTPKSREDILALIKPHKPGVSDADILAQIEDTMPRLEESSEEERGFAREDFQKDVYGVSKEAGKVGAQMRGAYGSGMGSGMRSAFAGAKDVTQQFKQAEQGYAEDIYGLEKKREEGFEADISTWLGNFKQGGRVPSKQTFLDVLSRIPDAGGN